MINIKKNHSKLHVRNVYFGMMVTSPSMTVIDTLVCVELHSRHYFGGYLWRKLPSLQYKPKDRVTRIPPKPHRR
jgi:hypothetical protein